jgi:nuclear pore complex protein Nup98-Nup96
MDSIICARNNMTEASSQSGTRWEGKFSVTSEERDNKVLVFKKDSEVWTKSVDFQGYFTF